LKKIITLMIICLFLSTSLSAISQSNQTDYSDDNLKFICSDSNGINEEKYQRYLQMFEQQNGDLQSLDEVESTNNIESFFIKQGTSDGGLMDSAWPMKCHDNCHTGRSPYSTADNNGAELWKFYTPGWIEGGVVVDDDGIIYFGSFDNYLYALFPNGTLKWKFDVNHWIWSTPAINSEGAIFIGSWDNYLYAINPDGSLKWKFWAGNYLTISSSPAISEEGMIYFGDSRITNGNDEIGRIHAINPDGTEKWYFDTGYSIISDPAIGDDGTVYIGSADTYFYAIKPNGQLKWKFKTDYYIKGPASIAEDGTIYFGSYDDFLYALNPDGSLKWKIKTGSGTETNPSIGLDGTIYVGDDKLYAINPDGTYKWIFNLGDNRRIHMSSPAISGDGIIHIGVNIGDSSGGEVIAINNDGTERWRRTLTSYWVESSPCINENGIVYIGCTYGIDDGYLYAFGPGDVNNPPNKPTISGPINGKYRKSYSYSIVATDPDGDDLSYFIDWGDGTNTGWFGLYSSGVEISESHSGSSDGTFTIQAKAKDTYDEESDWATLKVSMPKNNGFQQDLFLEKIILRFPILKHIF
jgi:outer membrane protein assembly factor BamB